MPGGIVDPLDELRLEVQLARAGLVVPDERQRYRPWRWAAQRRLYAKVGYHPTPGQRAFHQSTARMKVLAAGARYGKSLAASKEILPIVLTPHTNTWILGPTYDLAEKEWRYLVDDLGKLGLLDSLVVFQNGKPGYLQTTWGSRVWTRSADNPTSLLGEELDCILLSEASQLPERVLTRYVRARIGSRLGRLIIPTTPFGYNWVRTIYDRGVKQRDGAARPWTETVHASQFSVLENPYFEPLEYFAAQKELPEAEFAEQYDGRFVELAGRVFPQFQRARHVMPTLPERLQSATVWRTIDFGYEDPSCCLWVVFDRLGDEAADIPAGTFWVVGEVYERRLLTPAFAAMIKGHEWSVGKRLFATYGDMADAQARAQLSAYGVPVSADATRLWGGAKVPLDKAITAGLQTLRVLFHQRRILVHVSCENLIRELRSYTFAEGKDQPAPGQSDHAIDPLRYLIHSIAPYGLSAKAH